MGLPSPWGERIWMCEWKTPSTDTYWELPSSLDMWQKCGSSPMTVFTAVSTQGLCGFIPHVFGSPEPVLIGLDYVPDTIRGSTARDL